VRLTRRLWRGATLARLTYGIPHFNHEVNSNLALVHPALKVKPYDKALTLRGRRGLQPPHNFCSGG
jgi:hypothetical protein